MALACQRNSYLKELQTRVKSCVKSQLKTTAGGKKTTIAGSDVILEDTVLFPEGGGQPDDRGTIADEAVLRIVRRGADAVHFVEKEFEVGEGVHTVVDWDRRWDHMQQHSGQHLITAVADDLYGYPTTSWNLGEKTSFIELDTPNVTQEQVEEVERIVNEKIKEHIPMYPTLYSGLDDPKLREVRTRGLPDDHVGPVRVVTIEGIEANMCCGTHVSNLSHLQAIKLLAVEKGKKGKVNVVFVAGQRVLNYLGVCYQREKTFTTYLKGGPEQHVELLDKLATTVKQVRKNETVLLRDVAKLEVQLYLKTEPRPELFELHRKEGEMEFLNLVVNEINDESVCVFVTCGDVQGIGMFLISAPEEVLKENSQRILELLEGKGAVKKTRLQGKAQKLGQRGVVIELLKNALKQT